MGAVVDDEAADFLGAVHNETTAWHRCVYVNGTPITMKVDTGADVTAISESAYNSALHRTPQLAASRRILKGPDGRPLDVVGCFNTTLSIHSPSDRSSRHTVYVVRGLHSPLLGRPAITALRVLSEIAAVGTSCHSVSYVTDKFPTLFNGLGELKGSPYTIRLRENATPFSLSTPRRVPLPLQPAVDAELQRMVDTGVIRSVDQPTDWCSGMVVVPKPDGRVRVCTDFTRLNQSVRRERHMLPSIEHLLADVQGATYFSKLDANSGFHQVPLDSESQLLTTFITPSGRYCYNRLPFGISSAPEHFQKRMASLLNGCKGVICMMDDILVFGSTPEEHNERLDAILDRLATAGITLNRGKCVFGQTQVRFCGYVLDATGISPDPSKVSALVNMPPCENVSDVRRFLGMANQLGRFSPNLATLSQPLRDLLVKSNAWTWGQPQQHAFDKIKADLSGPTVLALYSPNRETCVSADASSFGLGAVLTQLQETGEWRPIAYQSRSMTPTEQRYSQIEKEALAATWACERFSHYLLGLTFRLETDHKPLVPLLSTKPLDQLPPRVVRFRLRLMRYSYTISHVPGKQLIVADALSRAPVSTSSADDLTLQAEVDAFLANTTDSLPASDERLAEIAAAQREDSICSAIVRYCKDGWPSYSTLHSPLKPYWNSRSEYSVTHDGLLLCSQRIVIPATLRLDILSRLHAGHQGIAKCRHRATQSVWWPGLSAELQNFITSCPTCARHRKNPAEPLLSTPIPTLPWQKVAADFLQLNNKTYLLVVDYFSKYIEATQLHTTTSTQTIRFLRDIFARHGIPEEFVSDNGPQFASDEFASFAREIQMRHVTSSPLYPQSNGMAERAVQTLKRLLRSTPQLSDALLSYRSTPLEHGFSPAELLFSRVIRSTIPTTIEQRKPRIPDPTEVRNRLSDLQRRQQRNFAERHDPVALPPLQPGASVYLPDRSESGQVVSSPATRSYVVSTPSGEFRRNRRHITNLPASVELHSDPVHPAPTPDAAQPAERAPSPTTAETGNKAILQPPLSPSLKQSAPTVGDEWESRANDQTVTRRAAAVELYVHRKD